MGAEIELAKLARNAVAGLSSWLKFDTANDGSLRTETYVAGTLPIFPQEDAQGNPILCVGMRRGEPYGLEVVTHPYQYTEFRDVMAKANYYLGHLPQNERTSVHIHVDADRETWKEVRNVLIWARALEAVIFRIACAGQIHRGARTYRGVYNDHMYARPLSTPIYMQWGNRSGPLINWRMLREATSASEFVASWGRLDQWWGHSIEHYMPHRTHFVNIMSILRTGTIEWRVFDGIYSHLDVFTDLVYNVHRLAGSGELPDFQFDLGAQPKIDVDWVNKLLNMEVGALWGENWQAACRDPLRSTHYPNNPVLPTLADAPVRAITVGRLIDDRSEIFPLYIRR